MPRPLKDSASNPAVVNPRSNGEWLGKAPMLWAMDEALGVPPELVSTLFVYARYADAEGRSSYPASHTVATQTRKSKSQAARDAARLERLGLLLPGDQSLVKHVHIGWRPKVYDLAMSRDASGCVASRDASERDAPASRGASEPSTRRIWSTGEAHPDASKEEVNRSIEELLQVGSTASRARAGEAKAERSSSKRRPAKPTPLREREAAHRARAVRKSTAEDLADAEQKRAEFAAWLRGQDPNASSNEELFTDETPF